MLLDSGVKTYAGPNVIVSIINYYGSPHHLQVLTTRERILSGLSKNDLQTLRAAHNQIDTKKWKQMSRKMKQVQVAPIIAGALEFVLCEDDPGFFPALSRYESHVKKRFKKIGAVQFVRLGISTACADELLASQLSY